jgi:tetratricopeptide (TPR) repeat protein
MNLYLFYAVGKYKEGLDYWKGLTLTSYKENSDVLIVTYHAACILNFCLGNYKEALKHCNWIINEFIPGVRNDFYITNLLIRIVIHFELKNYDTAELLIKKIRPALKAYNFFHPFDGLLLRQLKNAMRAKTQKEFSRHLQELEKEFERLSSKNENLNKLKIYFEFKDWIKAKVLQKEFKEVIQESKIELLKNLPFSI